MLLKKGKINDVILLAKFMGFESLPTLYINWVGRESNPVNLANICK